MAIFKPGDSSQKKPLQGQQAKLDGNDAKG